VDADRRVRGRSAGVRAWAVWELPRWVIAFIVVVVLADASIFAVEASRLSIRTHDVLLFAAALFCVVATVELTRRAGENAGYVKDVHGVWELPIAMLLPLAYAPLAPVVRFALIQWRVRQIPAYKRILSAAAIGLSYVAAAVAFHALIRLTHGTASNPAGHVAAWMAIVAVGAAVQWIVNQALLLTAMKGADRTVRLRQTVFAREPLYNDVSELCVAVLVTFCLANSVIALAFTFPFVTLLQRSLRHARLLKDSRADSKTGLLNAATWEHESTTEVARTVRTKSPLAVALLDIDRFKAINDTYGHLVGDQVIKEIAHTLNTLLRDYDLAGRFGGEEFSLLLPQTRAVDALRIAERVRANIAGLCIIAAGSAGGERVHVTVSIGVAALDSGDKREFTELMAAADAALYRAKACGRDQVQMISTTRGLSAVSSASRGINGAVTEDRQDAPSVFRRPVSGAVRSLPPLAGRRRGDRQDGEDRGAAVAALRRVAGTQHLWRVVPLAGPAAHHDRRTAAVAPHLAVPDLGRVLVLDLHRRAAVHGALGYLDDDRHVRRGACGAAGRSGG
jgi:diguanylate cyclase (GGDEF)-like protein